MLPPMTTIAQRIRHARLSKGLTQTELARLTGIGQAHLSRMESGERMPVVEDIPILAEHLGVTPAYLIGQNSGWSGLPPGIRKLARERDLPQGLADLAEHTGLMEALNVSEAEFRALASVDLPPGVTRDGYVQLLMTIRAITRG